jgi:hypothetical protein
MSAKPLAVALFVTSVLLFCDSRAVAWFGWIGTLLLLVAIGDADGRFRAVLWAFVVVAGAFVADLLWAADFAPFDRDADYESIPQTPFVFVGVPIPMILIAIGVGVRKLVSRT